MKVLHVCPLYYPSLGGNQIHVRTVSEKLVRLGGDVSLFTANAVGRSQFEAPDQTRSGLPEKENVNGVDVRRFRINYLLYALLTRKIIRYRGGFRIRQTLLGNAIEYWKLGPCVPAMLGAIKRLKPDLMLGVMENSFTSYVCYRVKKKYGIPFVFMPITHVVDAERPFQSFIGNLYKAADLIIACTEFEKNTIMNKGVPEAKIKILPLGLSPDHLPGRGSAKRAREKYGIKEKPAVAYIGRQDFHKGIETLIDAMKIVWEKHAEVQLLLAGKATSGFESVLKQRLAQLSDAQKEKTVDIGIFEEDEKEDLFAASDVVVMASKVDCFGLVYLESWASGVPVIACKNMPQETIIDDGLNGLLTEYGNAEDLAEKILLLLKEEKFRKNMGRNGREKFLREYDLDNYAARLKEAYEEVLMTKSR